MVGVATLISASPVHAVVVEVDPLNLATVTITDEPSAASGFVTYTFSVAPVLVSQEVTSIDASFLRP